MKRRRANGGEEARSGGDGGFTLLEVLIAFAILAIMLVPILMVVVSVTVDGQVARWIHIGAAIGLFAVNLVGLPTYPGLYDKFLIAVGLVFNALTVWIAWGWEPS